MTSALFLWWSVRDSNPRHHGCDPCALPAELTDRVKRALLSRTTIVLLLERDFTTFLFLYQAASVSHILSGYG